MTECSACGAELVSHETRCPICGKPTTYYHRQRRCLHCGTPASEKAITCMMCGKPVDSLPLNTSIFSGSWLGIGLGILIIVGIVLAIIRYHGNFNASADGVVQNTSSSIAPSTRADGYGHTHLTHHPITHSHANANLHAHSLYSRDSAG